MSGSCSPLVGCFFYGENIMAKVVSTLADGISYLNTLFNSSSSAPTSGEEDYLVWTGLFNIAVSVWEQEEGILWKELFVKLSDASTGDKTATSGDYSYTCPSDFRFPASGYVWIGSGSDKTPFRVIRQEDLTIYENDSANWCYFTRGASPTLNFNPNCEVPAGTISYNYYKYATKLSSGTDVFEMSDPMFAVYYALAELKKEEGNAGELQIATQKLEAMKTRNETPTWKQADQALDVLSDGFGY